MKSSSYAKYLIVHFQQQLRDYIIHLLLDTLKGNEKDMRGEEKVDYTSIHNN